MNQLGGIWVLGAALAAVVCLAPGASSTTHGQEAVSPPEESFDFDQLGANAESEEDEIEEFLETDRNSFTFSRLTAGPGRVFVEGAYSFINVGSEGQKHSFPEALVRVGLGKRAEFRVGYNFETGSESEAPEGDITNNFGINAEQQMSYGFKFQITSSRSDRRWIPVSALLTECHTPIGTIAGDSQIRLGYSWGWRLPNGWEFDSAMRFGTDRLEDDRYNLWVPSTVLKIPFGREKRWFTHLEYVSIMSQGRKVDFSDQFIDTGLHRFLTPNFEVGTIVAFGINDQARGILVNVGFGIRF